jgi:hypothetical protein
MVTQPIKYSNSKMLHGGADLGNKRFPNPKQNSNKRGQNTKGVVSNTSSVVSQTSTMTQKPKGNSHPNHNQQQYRGFKQHPNNPQQHPTRTSPNPGNTTNSNNTNKNNQQHQQQRYQNRQTPPRQVTNHVIMNNGQPSLVELTQTTSTSNPSPKAIIKNSQKSAQDPSFRSKKGHSVPNQGSRASPVNNNLSKSNRSSPQGFAGSKCFEPPTPNSLPKPPSDWTPFQLAGKENLFGDVGILNFGEMIGSSPEKHTDVSQQLKLILNANA